MADTIDLMTKRTMIKNQACFSRLTDEENEALAALLVEKTFAAGETIVKEGDPVDSVYLIVKGNADVRHVRFNHNEEEIQSIATLGEGNTIGLSETGFYSLSGVRTATVVANTDMLTLRLSVAQFNGFALAYSHVKEVMRTNVKALSSRSE